jgi:hypothetical protein
VTSTEGRRFNPLSLDAVNFLLADVRGALGPYLNVLLVTRQHWSLSEVGLVTTIGWSGMEMTQRLLTTVAKQKGHPKVPFPC